MYLYWPIYRSLGNCCYDYTDGNGTQCCAAQIVKYEEVGFVDAPDTKAVLDTLEASELDDDCSNICLGYVIEKSKLYSNKAVPGEKAVIYHREPYKNAITFGYNDYHIHCNGSKMCICDAGKAEIARIWKAKSRCVIV